MIQIKGMEKGQKSEIKSLIMIFLMNRKGAVFF